MEGKMWVGLFIAVLLYSMGEVKGAVKTLDNSNFMAAIKNTTHRDLAIACLDGSQRSMAVSFLITWLEVSSRHKNESDFAYCNSQDAPALVGLLGLSQLPALIFISQGVAYIAYGQKHFSDINALHDFVRRYPQLSQSQHPLPDPSVYPFVYSEQETSGLSLTFTDICKQGPMQVVFALTYGLLGNTMSNFSQLPPTLLGLFAAPVILGLLFCFLGWLSETKAAFPQKPIPADKKTK